MSNGSDVPRTVPAELRASTATTGYSAGRLRVVSNAIFSHRPPTGPMCAALGPAITCHAATDVAPFQEAQIVVFPLTALIATAGGVSGWPSHSKRKPR